MAQEYEVVGKSVPKVDALDKVMGAPVFTSDVVLPNMLHGKLLRSPYGHARVKSIDTSAAEAMPGVAAVITYEDTPSVKYNPWLDAPDWVEPADHMVLTSEPLYDGDAVAAVAAVDEKTALEALKRINVEWEILPAVLTVDEALAPEALQLHEGHQNNVLAVIQEPHWVKGDVGRGFEEAEHIVQGVFETQDIQHAPMERHCSVADYNVARNELTVYEGTQNAFPLATRLTYVFGFNKGPVKTPVRVVTRPVGGSFGGNHHLFQHTGCGVVLSMKTGRPVRCALSREETFKINKRYAARLTCKMGCDKQGKVTAIRAEWLCNAGAYAICTVANTAFPMNMWLTAYSFPNVDIKVKSVYTNTNPNTPFRGFGSPQAFFGFEALMDELAEKAGIDPVDFRLLNITKVGDTVAASQTLITSSGMRECFERGRAAFGWDEKRSLRDRPGPKKRGVGVAGLTHCTGLTKFSEGWNESSSAVVYVGSDGFVTLITGATDTGQGIYTTLLQMVAETMGVPYENVRLQSQYVDTAAQPWDWGCFGSRSCYIPGQAAVGAAAEAKRALLEYASELLEVDDPTKLDIKKGIVFVKDEPERSVPFAEATKFATETSDHAGQIIGKCTFHPTENPPPFGVQFVEVEVDTETGQVRVVNVVAAQDVGKAINKQIVEGQVQGALLQGTGFALMEQLKWGPEGRLRTGNYLDYQVPRSTDTPQEGLQVIVVEPIDPTGPFGAKGVGEPAMVPTAAAIGNAVYNATGVRMRKLPLSCENVLMALREAK